MPIPALAQVSVGTVVGTGTGQVSLPNVTIGSLILLYWVTDGSTYDDAFSAFSGVRNLADSANGYTVLGTQDAGAFSMVTHAWAGRANASTVTTDITVGAAGNDLFMLLFEFSRANQGSTISDVFENGSVSLPDSSNLLSEQGSSTTVADQSVQTNGPDRLAVNIVNVNGDQNLSAFSGQTGGTWATRYLWRASTGSVMTIQLQTADMPSAGTIDGGTQTITSAGWGSFGFAIKPAPDPYRIPIYGQVY